MVQNAIVTKLMPDGMAEVSVVRSGACGKGCANCEGCSQKSELRVLAHNQINAHPGTKVEIQSSNSAVFGAVMLVYLLPMASMLIVFFVAAKFGFGEGICVLSGFIVFFLGVCCMLMVNKFYRGKNAIEYYITKELNCQ